MRFISVVINLDTRKGWLEDQSEERIGIEVGAAGTRSLDYLIDGVECKRRFFHELPIEVILFIDTHEPLPQHVLAKLHEWQDNGTVDTVVFSKHREDWNDHPYFPRWHDINYLNALTLARGDYVAHFDADVACFSKSSAIIRQWIEKLERKEWSFISYPSPHSPAPIADASFDYWWASTRFFLTQRENIQDHTEILKCLIPGTYIWDTYGDRQRKCPWTEHVLGLIADKKYGRAKSVYYPPLGYDQVLIWSWKVYRKGLYQKLMGMTFDQVSDQVQRWGGVQYPNDVLPT